MDRCVACGKPIVLINYDKLRGVIGLTMVWIHVSWWANRSHKAIPPEMVRNEYQ